MQKLLPVIVIGSALVFTACSPSRWFGGGDNEPQVNEFGAGIEIEELSQDGRDELLTTPAADLETLKLETTSEDATPASGSGVVRYQYDGDMAEFLVTTDLDTSKAPYSVWLQGVNGEDLTLAFKLQDGKGGAWGSASVPLSRLPLEVLVAGTDAKADVANSTILSVTIPAPATPSAE